jgi:hypothetical protein
MVSCKSAKVRVHSGTTRKEKGKAQLRLLNLSTKKSRLNLKTAGSNFYQLAFNIYLRINNEGNLIFKKINPHGYGWYPL